MKSSKPHLFMTALLLILFVAAACSPAPAPAEGPGLAAEPSPGEGFAAEPANGFPELTVTEMILATTTSTENSGLLAFILPDFTAQYGIDVKVVAVGSGAAFQMGADGEADVLLAHAKDRELELVEAGHTLYRFDVMYNDFIIVGPPDDPAGLLQNPPADVLAALERIRDVGATFVSRGDDSGTHIMELNLWKEIGVADPQGSWYISAGQGMGDVIIMANELEGYALTDRATYLAMRNTNELVVVLEEDPRLFNQYGVLAVNPEKGDHINYPAAVRFVDWILSPKTQELIRRYGMEEYGVPLFYPNAH